MFEKLHFDADGQKLDFDGHDQKLDFDGEKLDLDPQAANLGMKEAQYKLASCLEQGRSHI
eukprot:1392347-Amorphochlora_amoeboformis.AAC.1